MDMADWEGWIAAIGGVAAIIGQAISPSVEWLVYVGGAVAVIFGIWGAAAE